MNFHNPPGNSFFIIPRTDATGSNAAYGIHAEATAARLPHTLCS
jgi:hypothetical protein